jgi:NitT/TauT family transport system substrate-binding protein
VRKKLEYGMPTDKSAPSVQFGIARGYFRDEGIDLSVRAVYGGPALAAAYSSGELAFGHLGTPPALVALSRGARFRIVGSAIKKRVHLYLGLHSSIGEVGGLRGGRIGLLSMGSCDEWVGRSMLQAHGLEAGKDVHFVPIGAEYARVVDLIAERRIDAALAIEPNMSAGEERGVLRIRAAAYDEPYLPVFQWTVLVASDELAGKDPGLVRALLRAYARSAHAASRDVEEYISFVAEIFDLPPSVARRSVLREVGHYELDCRLDGPGLDKAIALQTSLDALARPITVNEVVDSRYLPS